MVAQMIRVREDRLGRLPTGEVVPPSDGSGRPYAYSLRHRDWRFSSNSAESLLAVVIKGYPHVLVVWPRSAIVHRAYADDGPDGSGPSRRLDLRIRHAERVRFDLQVHALVDAPAGAALMRDVLSLTRRPPVLLEPWTHDVPLVLVATDYAPHTDLPCPSGTIRWLRPSTAQDYLHSLAELGRIALAVRRPG